MALRTFVSSIVQSGDTVTNTTTKTSFASCLNMPATPSTDPRYGQTFDIDLHGYISTDGSAPGTLTITVDYGTGNSGTTLSVLGTTGAFTPPSGLSNAYWTLKGKAVFHTTSDGVLSTSGVATFSGAFTIQGSSNAALIYGMVTVGTGNTGWASGIATSTFYYNLIEASVTWGSALATNSITLAGGSAIQQIA